MTLNINLYVVYSQILISIPDAFFFFSALLIIVQMNSFLWLSTTFMIQGT